MQLHGERNRRTLSDSLLQGLPGTGVLRAKQPYLVATPIIGLALRWGSTTHFQNPQNLRVGQRLILCGRVVTARRNRERRISVQRCRRLGIGRPRKRGRCNGRDRVWITAAYGVYISLGIRQRLEVPHVEVQPFTAIGLTCTTREECEWLQVR